MRYRQLGSSDITVSIVGLGTWAMGGRDYGRVDDADSIKAIHRALDFGITFFDTAPIYGNGHAEEVLGRALGPERKGVVIATKCGPIEVPGRGLIMDLSPSGIRKQCEESLRRLRTDWVDVLYIHWSDPAWPVEDAVLAIEGLVTSGMVRAIGVSNFTAAELQAAAQAARVVTLQAPYSLLCRKIEKEILPLCKQASIGVVAYEPLARGLLSGKAEEKRRFDEGDIRRKDPRFYGLSFMRHLEAVSELSKLATRNGMSTAQLSIGWVIAQEGISSAVFGAKTAAQVAENARAADEELDAETATRAAKIMECMAEIEEGGSSL